MPAENDIIQATLVWDDAAGQQFLNVFKFRLDDFIGVTWGDVGDELEAYFEAFYTDWLENVANSVQSSNYEISLRDEVAGEWNQVFNRDYTELVGATPAGSLPALNCATIVAYPGTVRFWGFKNMPPPNESAVDDQGLVGSALVDLALSALIYHKPYIGVLMTLTGGVYNLGQEAFRAFAFSSKITNIVGSRVTRKDGRGI